MPDENTENLDSPNEDKDAIVLNEDDDIDAVKEKFGQLSEKSKKTFDDNKQLFSRAKKAEGFELKDGKWTKIEKSVEKVEKKSEEKKPDTQLVDKIDRLTLQAGGIKEKEEVELANKWKEKTGRELDEILTNEIFIKELQQIRDDKANEVATTGVKGDAKTSGAKLTAEYWNSKGTPPTAEEVPDKKTRVKIIREMMKGESSGSFRFYND